MKERTVKNTIRLILLFLAVISSPTLAAVDELAEEMKELAALLPGTYDNAVQFAAEAKSASPDHLRLGRRAQFFARIERPRACCVGFTAGEDAAFFYMRIYTDGKLWLGGEHIVVIYPDRERDQLVWQFIRIAAPERFLDLHLDVEKQKSVPLIPQPKDVLDCPVVGRKTGPNQFRAELINGGCNVISRVSGNLRRLEMHLTLSPETMLYLDRGIEDGKVVHGSVDGTPFDLRRVAP